MAAKIVIRVGSISWWRLQRLATALAVAVLAISANGQTVIGPSPPIETSDGVNWFAGHSGATQVSVADTSFPYNSAEYDGMLSNSAASGSGSGNNADFRCGAFPLNGAQTVEISFYYYAANVKSGDNVRVDLRMYQSANDVGFIDDNNQHPFTTGKMSGYALYNSGPITVPPGATYADIRVSINTFGDDTWSSGTAYFDDFLVTTLTGPPFFTEQPFSATVSVSSAFTNSVLAAGPPPVSYQWYENGAPVTDDLNHGTNYTLTLSSVQPSDNSTNYCVVASNNYGAVTSAVVSLLVSTNLAAGQNATGLTWTSGQYLPTFSTPAPRIDCIDMDIVPPDQQVLFCSLEGIVNRTQPRLACISATSEGEFTWLGIHGLACDTIAGTNAILKYKASVTGLVVYDTNVMDTVNLATTIAGVKNELICDGALLYTLTNPPYSLTVSDDLRGKFTSSDQIYGYLYTNYWSQCTHRIIAGMETNNFWHLRDYLIAVKSAVVWLDPGTVTGDANIFKLFASDMSPVGGVYLGWWPNEGADMNWIGSYGLPVMASDFFDNGSVYSGAAMTIPIPPVPPLPPLQNKIYVSITLSEGDNVQYMQHAMYQNWQSTNRGAVPIGWTVQPLLVDFDPGMLNYYWSTATTNDCLVAGPSGAGYTHVESWGSANVGSYTKASNFYLQRSGIRTVTIWDNVSGATGDAYATNCPTLIGVSDEDDGYYTGADLQLPILGLPSTGNYASTAASLVNAITNTAASWGGSAPMFIAVQGVAWSVTPADCQTVAASLDPAKYVIVRPDQIFLLYQESVGLSKGGAPPYLASAPASQSAAIGASVTFAVSATGTSPMSYQWLFNGNNIAGATNATYVRSAAEISDAGNYQVIVTNLYGSVTSSIVALTFGNQPLGFNGDGLNWTVSESGYYVYSPPAVAGNVLDLTDGAVGEDRAAFFNNPQHIGAFSASFVYQAGGNKAADGIAFCIQNDPRGPSASGGGGEQLGVGPTPAITPSIELELNLYTGNNEKVGYLLATNGLTGANGANGNYLAPGNVQINSGDPITITLKYVNPQLSITFTDTVAQTSFATNLFVGNLAQLLGTNAAYIGFTGADGGASSIQTISDFSFLSFPSATIGANSTNFLVSWPGGTPGYTLQQNSSLTTMNWANVTNQPVLSNGLNQVTTPNNGSNLFYRLVLPLP